MTAMERARTHTTMFRRLADGQGGFVREALFFLVLVTLFALVLLDAIAIYSTHRAVKEDAKKAAQVAVATYVATANDAAAQQAAIAYLDAHKSSIVTFTVQHGEGKTVYQVTAKRDVNTLLLKYVGRLPKVGDWMDRQLHPVATADGQ